MLSGFLVLGSYLWVISQDLPDYESLARYEPPVMTRIHAGDGSLIGEYGYERRIFIPVGSIPKVVMNAFVAAEDKNFFAHSGVDPFGVARASVANISNIMQDKRLEGGSTITQQVAKNFLLSNEVSMTRKVKEALLAFRIDRAFSKERILELYLNEIYLGQRSYGVAAAALNYYGKALSELTVAEAAYLAALPKGPNDYHPFRHTNRAIERRNWVIGRMKDLGYIDTHTADEARAAPLIVINRPMGAQTDEAQYFVEEVRRQLAQMYGEDTLYKQGLSVRTSLDPHLQAVARRALRAGLLNYDHRHGWRGPVTKIEITSQWPQVLAAIDIPADLEPWRLGVVLELSARAAIVGLRPKGRFVKNETPPAERVLVALENMSWARRALPGGGLGGAVTRAADVVAVGDAIYVSPLKNEQGKSIRDRASGFVLYALEQKPKVEGAIISLDPHTGRVLAMVGGFSYDKSEFNRATQALRQPGSAFKPFVYAAALDNGYTPSSLVLDAPIALSQGAGRGLWRPANYGGEFYGPSTLRLGIEKSRNVMTVRLAKQIGMEHVVDYARRFGVTRKMEPVLAMALGAGETTLYRLTAAYGMMVNGGKFIEPSLIDRVQDRYGKTIYRHDKRPCEHCKVDAWQTGLRPPVIPDERKQVIEASTAYQVVSMLEGVVQRGTAWRLREMDKPLAGKTGTTNDERDAWFVGFSPDLVTGAFVGFDTPTPMGYAETGGRLAVPIFQEFMVEALKNTAPIPFRIPPGVTLVRVHPKTGQRVGAGTLGAIYEPFKVGTEPGFGGETVNVIGGGDFIVEGGNPAGGQGVRSGTGGLY
jgi:penicillin-binding protein 1A